MSLGNDFLTLIEPLWDVEQFNMWNPRAHSTVAYVLGRFYGCAQYDERYARWLSLAREKDYNAFAWEISQAVLDAYRTDERVEQADIDYMEKAVAAQYKRYTLQQLYAFGLVSEKYVPDWFFGLFHSYYTLEETKRETAIRHFLMEQCEMSDKKAEAAFKKLASYIDILAEFYFYVKNKRFKEFYPITVQSISAKQLVETTYLSPVGAYNYLIYLRESPKEALADLKNGLPRK